MRASLVAGSRRFLWCLIPLAALACSPSTVPRPSAPSAQDAEDWERHTPTHSDLNHLQSRALDGAFLGSLRAPGICEAIQGSPVDSRLHLLCGRVQMAVGDALEGGIPRVEFPGYVAHRLAVAESLLTTFTQGAGLSPQQLSGLASMVAALMRPDCVRSEFRNRCDMLQASLGQIAANLAFQQQVADLCQPVLTAVGPQQPGSCLEALVEQGKSCFQQASRFRSPETLLVASRQLFLCLEYPVSQLSDLEAYPLRSLAIEFVRSALASGVAAPESDHWVMPEVRLRMAALALFAENQELALSWLAYGLQQPEATLKQALLFQMLQGSPDSPTPAVKKLLARMVDSNTPWASLAGSILLELPAGRYGMQAFQHLLAWAARTDPELLAKQVRAMLKSTRKSDHPLLASVGPVLEAFGNSELAEQAFRAAVGIAPTTINTVRLGLFYHQSGRKSEAAKVFRLIDTEPRFIRLQGYASREQAASLDLLASHPTLKRRGSLPVSTGSGWCAPFAIWVLRTFWSATPPLTLPQVASTMIEDASGKTPIETLLEVLKITDWRIGLFKAADAPEPDSLVDQVKYVLNAGYPVMVLMSIVDCESPQPVLRSEGHIALITGFDDALGTFKLTDMNWFAGITQLSYEQVQSGAVVPVVVVPTSQKSTAIEAHIEFVDPQSFVDRSAAQYARRRPVCFE